MSSVYFLLDWSFVRWSWCHHCINTSFSQNWMKMLHCFMHCYCWSKHSQSLPHMITSWMAFCFQGKKKKKQRQILQQRYVCSHFTPHCCTQLLLEFQPWWLLTCVWCTIWLQLTDSSLSIKKYFCIQTGPHRCGVVRWCRCRWELQSRKLSLSDKSVS